MDRDSAVILEFVLWLIRSMFRGLYLTIFVFTIAHVMTWFLTDQWNIADLSKETRELDLWIGENGIGSYSKLVFIQFWSVVWGILTVVSLRFQDDRDHTRFYDGGRPPEWKK